MFKFPEEKPNLKEDHHGWFSDDNKSFLKNIISDNTSKIIELGAWLGNSTLWFCQNSKATIYSIDHWKGSKEHQGRKDVKDKLPTLYETFIVNCWDYKERIVPIKMNTIDGLRWCKSNNINPDMIFVDASHEFEDVILDLEECMTLFPNAMVTGDDWNWKNKSQNRRKTVQEAVVYFSKKYRYKITENGRCWLIKK
jgi:hypothetical protein